MTEELKVGRARDKRHESPPPTFWGMGRRGDALLGNGQIPLQEKRSPDRRVRSTITALGDGDLNLLQGTAQGHEYTNG